MICWEGIRTLKNTSRVYYLHLNANQPNPAKLDIQHFFFKSDIQQPHGCFCFFGGHFSPLGKSKCPPFHKWLLLWAWKGGFGGVTTQVDNSILLMAEIPIPNHLEWCWNPMKNGIFSISTGDRRILWTINSDISLFSPNISYLKWRNPDLQVSCMYLRLM